MGIQKFKHNLNKRQRDEIIGKNLSLKKIQIKRLEKHFK